MFCEVAALVTESDVEQKLLWPLLTTAAPAGFGYSPADLVTKLSIQRLPIGKGTSRKLYFPDYLVLLAGLPLLVIEAKAPTESVDGGLDEARLYASEINARLPSGLNPCGRVLACNGRSLVSAPADTATPDIRLEFGDLSIGHLDYARLVDLCKRASLQAHVNVLRARFRKGDYIRPVTLVGGDTFQNQELPQNTFGATIAGDYGHIFNPRTRAQRAFIARNGYVSSLRRQRMVEPIDRLIRNAVAPVSAKLPTLENSSQPTEITRALVERDRSGLENQVLLLVGSVGAGKSTFIDHLTVVALPEELRRQTLWLRTNLNEAPLAKDRVYSWLAESLVEEFREQCPEIDFDDVSVLQKVFAPELNKYKKGPLALLPVESVEYATRLSDRLSALQASADQLAKAIARYTCGGPNRLLVIVLDNCDKRTRDEQLLMFQIAQWAQREFHALVVLPLRDVTYDLHRHEPPLDTALKGLVFRIEPPSLSDVLQSRVRLALSEMQSRAELPNELSFDLPNGYRVSYPASDQAKYLASILRSLYAHDRFIRNVMTGLAGRDVRRALEV